MNITKIRNYFHIEKRSYYLFFFLATLLFIAYHAIYWNKIYPVTDGWGLNYANLVFEGKFPYKDFYYYLPPLNLLIDSILWRFSFGYLLIYRLFRLVERFIILYLLYRVLCHACEPFYAGLLSFIGIITSTATVYDLGGDYNQSCDLIIILICNVLVSYINYFHFSNEKKEKKHLFLLGFLLGLAFLLKQTVFVASVSFIFIFLTILFFINKHPNYFISILYTIIGFLIPIILCFLFLFYHLALIPFFEQVFLNASSKGSLMTILTSLFKITLTYKSIYLSILTLLCFYFIIHKHNWHNLVFLFVIISGFFFAFETDFQSLYPLLNSRKGHVLLFVFIVLLVFAIAWDHLPLAGCTMQNIIMVGDFIIILFLFYYLVKNTRIASKIYSETNSFILINDFSEIICIISLLLMIYELYLYKQNDSIQHVIWSLLFVCGLINMYTVAMTCTDRLSARAIVFSLPILLCWLINHMQYYKHTAHMVLVFLCMFICASVTSQKITCAYSWWGTTTSVLNNEHNCTPNIKAMRGLRLSAYDAEMYNRLYEVLQENTTSDTTVYSFPYIQIFNVLLNNTNEAGFVPVPFYDTCADKYAIEDAKLLAQNPPDILIWCDIPGCMEAHENIFRNGEELGQRSIQRLFSVLVRRGDYSLVGQYNNIFIYKYNVNDLNRKTTYTDIEDASRVNSTLQ